MRKRRRTCTHIYLGSNDKRFEYVTDGNVKLADSVTIERWVVRLMACTKAWMRLDADGMRTINGTRIEGLLNIELQWLAELTKARTIDSETFSVDDDDADDGEDNLKLRPLKKISISALPILKSPGKRRHASGRMKILVRSEKISRSV
ncbi:hypothetical protein [Sutterella wadsworthensis]|uniref:hypothetical protein n=1 Tax=Sutterella wadsworthensis TaxID=40545 RepID=UPI0039678F57